MELTDLTRGVGPVWYGSSRAHLNPRDWTCDQVLDWLTEELRLEEYVDDFLRAKVDGPLLFRLASDNGAGLERTLRITHPLHRRRVVNGVARLKEKEVEELGVSFDELNDYIAKLDTGRLSFVARLKVLFDAEDSAKSGSLEPEQVRTALSKLTGKDAEGAGMLKTEVEAWVEDLKADKQTLSFVQFVEGVSKLLQQGGDSFGDGGAHAQESSPSKKHGKRIRLVDGHVELDAAKSPAGKRISTGGGKGLTTLVQVAQEMEEDKEGEDGSDSGENEKKKQKKSPPAGGGRRPGFEWDSVTQVRGWHPGFRTSSRPSSMGQRHSLS